jgi:hypothetical protein
MAPLFSEGELVFVNSDLDRQLEAMSLPIHLSINPLF